MKNVLADTMAVVVQIIYYSFLVEVQIIYLFELIVTTVGGCIIGHRGGPDGPYSSPVHFGGCGIMGPCDGLRILCDISSGTRRRRSDGRTAAAELRPA